jgi:glycosyltransferase involved in cell wall biosynthesis
MSAARSQPQLISVIVPARDAAATIAEQLAALARQDYSGPWEVVVADSGSRDGTRAIAAQRLSKLVSGRLIDAAGTSPNGASRARNLGATAAGGDLLAFCDADDVVSSGWLSAIASAAREADIVAGPLEVESLNPPGLRLWHETPRWEHRRPLHRFLPCASSANCAVWRDVFDALGGFDESGPGAEDKDFAWRAQLAGYRVRAAPEAVVAYRYRSGLAAGARQHYVWGLSNARLFRDFGAAGLERTRLVDALHAWAWTVYSVPALPWSPVQRGRWVLRTAQRVGQLVGSVRHRVVYL